MISLGPIASSHGRIRYASDTVLDTAQSVAGSYRKVIELATTSVPASAVVGVILNLAMWFGLHGVFGRVEQTHFGPLRLFVPQWSTIDWAAAAIAAVAALMLLRWKRGVPLTLAVCTAAGAIVYWLRSGTSLTT